jgi:alpha-galactosidase
VAAAGYVWPAWIFAETGQTEQSWTLGNELVERVVAFEPGRGLYTKKLSCLAMHRDFISAESVSRYPAEFSFLCDGKLCASNGGGFELIGAKPEALAKGKSLTVKLRHKTAALEASVVYRIYDGHPALRKHLVLLNTGSAPLRITHLNIETLELAMGPANELTLLAQYGTVPREIFYTGRSEDGGLLLVNGVTGDGMAVVSEVPGYMKRTEIAGWDAPDTVRASVMYDTDLMPFERRIAGGEAFATAAALLVAFRKGDGFNDPQWRLPSYAAEVLERRVDALGAPWIYNTWEPFERGINEKTVMELIEAAGAMGMDVFTIDDGWQLELRREHGEPGELPGRARSDYQGG